MDLFTRQSCPGVSSHLTRYYPLLGLPVSSIRHEIANLSFCFSNPPVAPWNETEVPQASDMVSLFTDTISCLNTHFPSKDMVFFVVYSSQPPLMEHFSYEWRNEIL